MKPARVGFENQWLCGTVLPTLGDIQEPEVSTGSQDQTKAHYSMLSSRSDIVKSVSAGSENQAVVLFSVSCVVPMQKSQPC